MEDMAGRRRGLSFFESMTRGLKCHLCAAAIVVTISDLCKRKLATVGRCMVAYVARSWSIIVDGLQMDSVPPLEWDSWNYFRA
ncbi:hypothetical protein ACVWZM_009000 [Bradyrhizobium sp. USDA 4501]